MLFRRRIKHPFFLLEILIGLALVSILLTCLFTAMTKGAALESRLDDARSISLQRQHFQTKLHDLFLSPSLLYTKKLADDQRKESLILMFDHGIDPDPQFSGSVIGRIYLDEKNNLSLALWPSESKSQSWRKEILLSNVQEFQFSFLGKIDKHVKKKINSELGWHEKWIKSREDVPSMIRLRVKQKETTCSYAFFPCKNELVNYFENGFRS